jgi:hypothetical protein
MWHSLQLLSSMLLLLSLSVVLVEAQQAQIQVPDCLPAAKANWNWVSVPFAGLCDCSMTSCNANRHTTPSSRPLVQQPATWPQNATMAVRLLFFADSSRKSHEMRTDFTIPKLVAGNHYTGPTTDDKCQCNSVLYSVISACAGCQKGTWLTCARFSPRLLPFQLTPRLQLRSMDCQLRFARRDVNVRLATFWGTVALDTKKKRRFPEAINNDTRIPAWAFLNVTVRIPSPHHHMTTSKPAPHSPPNPGTT